MRHSKQFVRCSAAALAACACALLAACGGSDDDKGYSVEIRRTTGGVPHVKGTDLASAGYGMGYVWAQDHACTMSGRWLTTSAQAAQRFGRDGPTFSFDARNGNLASDLYIQKLITEGWLDRLMQDKGPTGVLPEVRELVRGYVAGYNRYLKEVDYTLSDPRCAGADWIRPITERDVYLNATWWADMLTAVRNELPGYLAAVPPGAAATPAQVAAAAQADEPAPKVTASNMVALGKGATQSGHGMLFSNPHWEWNTADGMVAAHMTVPGLLNVNGMTFGASPVIGIGHNDKVAWGHTSAGAAVTNGVRYRLQLVPGSPTSYIVDGVRHEMVPTRVTVQVRNASGAVEPYTHTFYETMFGTVSVSTSRPWTAEHAYTWKHSPLKVSGLNMWYLYAKAQSVDDVHQADRRTMGVAWINTTAADTQGRAYRSMPTPLPYVTDEMIANCSVTAGVLDGRRQACAPIQDAAAPFPGVFPPSMMPFQFRDDYTYNANDSHWISNPHQPLEGYPSLFGPERTVQSHRTRAGLQIIEERIAGTDGAPGKGFTLDLFVSKLFDGREYARLWQADLVDYCNQLAGTAGAPASLGQACTAIAGWKGTYHLDDPGAVLFRRFVERSGTGADRYTVPFDPADPLNTPRGLNRSTAVRDALYGAMNDLAGSGIPLDASLRGYQYRQVGSERIPLPGGNIFQRLNTAPFAGADGWRATSGSSFIYWVEMRASGPVGKQIQVQGQSDDPTSPLHTDQTRRYSAGNYLDIRFTEQEVLADPGLTTQVLKAKADGSF
ncbi:penicillin acylase family protein [Aquincola sp. MAHUQ-54]|uniref:Penicillin acylase family protein n=1 Tax=Aquincola agrisoli TaxID=3119538 RepID=A0AAW9QJY6_9BURK